MTGKSSNSRETRDVKYFKEDARCKTHLRCKQHEAQRVKKLLHYYLPFYIHSKFPPPCSSACYLPQFSMQWFLKPPVHLDRNLQLFEGILSFILWRNPKSMTGVFEFSIRFECHLWYCVQIWLWVEKRSKKGAKNHEIAGLSNINPVISTRKCS